MSRATFPDKGSSPRVRGTLFKDAGCTVGAGIIPACAGNTTVSKTSRRRSGDHPRVCGEHRDQILQNLRDLGSSPRVRGTLLRHEGLKILAGIIPACAGNTGKHSPLSEGSSPRVRGTPTGHHPGTFCAGIIPACAGNTNQRFELLNLDKDHPRVCGEHVNVLDDVVDISGSSPRVRGTPS